MASTFINEFKVVLEQGGIVLWLMTLLSITLYTLLTSTWLVLRSVQKQFLSVQEQISEMSDPQLVEDEVYLFELDEISWVRRRLPVLSVLLALSPLSGLLGTVSGMLNTFAGLSSASTAKPIDSISSGISEALVTTQVGLLIAIPGAFLYAFIRRKLDKVTEQLHQTASQHIIQIKKAS